MKKRWMAAALALAAAGMVGMLAAAANEAATQVTVGRQPDGRIVVPTNQVLDPAGFQVEFPGRPSDLALSPDGSLLAVMSHKSLVLLRVRDQAIMQTLPVPQGGHTFVGIAWFPDGSAILTSSTEGVLNHAVLKDSIATWDTPLALPAAGKDEDGDEISALPGGLALEPGGNTLYVCLNQANALAVMDLPHARVRMQIPVGVAPYGVVLSGSKAYVSNWGGRRAQPGDATADTAGTPAVVDPQTGVVSTGTVSVIDLAAGKVTAEIPVGLHPCGMTLDRRTGRLFVANANSDTVSVIDTGTDRVMETIAVSPAEALPFGSAPNAVALSPEGLTLYVANGGNNAIAVVQLGTAVNPISSLSATRITGFIPTGWYPGSVTVSADGKTLFVANVKGVGSLSVPTDRPGSGGRVPYQVHDHRGSLSLIPVPDARTLADYSRRVAENNRQAYALANLRPRPRSERPVTVPLHQGERSIFEHVIYIIKENRTYDQVLGDMKEGNGDPSLVHYGEEVTPNHHQLAREFVLLDNFYCSGVLSADGHQWTDEALVTDYLEKSFGGFERSYPYDGGDPLAYASSGFLWDNALRHGRTFRDYGEFVKARIEPASATWADIWADYQAGTRKVTIRATTTVDSLRPHLCPTYVGFPGKVQDVYRAGEFIKELRQFEAAGKMPNLIVMLLPNDHTAGTRPGIPTPQAMVADNDLALGQIVEAVSRSRFWPRTCIFVVEDDPQAGLDHVDGHRTVAFVISPYSRRRGTDSSNYNQTSMVRTIELMLGLPPMNQFDLSATPMVSCFGEKPDLAPYRALPNRIPLDQMNPPLSALSGKPRYWAARSLELPLEEIDEADEDTFNRILWHAAKGYDTPYPQVAVLDRAGASQGR